MIYGYARCSTNEERQDIDRQKRELKKLGVSDDKCIYWEYESGAKKDRVELMKLLDIVKAGDTIITTEVSRLTRSTSQLCEIMQIVQERHLQLLIGSFNVDCRSEEIDAMTKGMIMMWGVFSEMERDIITERIKSGMRNAKAKGKKLGRKELTINDIPSSFGKYYRLYQNKEMNITEIAKVMNRSRTTIYKYIEMLK